MNLHHLLFLDVWLVMYSGGDKPELQNCFGIFVVKSFQGSMTDFRKALNNWRAHFVNLEESVQEVQCFVFAVLIEKQVLIFLASLTFPVLPVVLDFTFQ